MNVQHPFRVGFYICIVIGGLLATLFYSPFPLVHDSQMDYMALLLFFVLLVLLDCYPVKVGETFISLKLIASIVIFLEFGFLAELILSQVAYLIAVSFTERRFGLKHILRHGMFFLMSLASAAAFYVTLYLFPFYIGGTIPIVSIFSYVLVGFIANQFVLNWVRWISTLSRLTFEWKAIKWDFLTTLLAVPVSTLLIIAYESELGILGSFIIAVPTMIIAYIFKLTNDVQLANQQMGVIHQLTSTFTTELDIERNLDALVVAIENFYSFDTCYIFQVDKERQELTPLRFEAKENYHREELLNLRLPLNVGVSGRVACTGKSAFVNNVIETPDMPNLPSVIKKNRSVLAVPLKIDDEVIGVIFLGSYKERGFSKKERILIEILARYAANSIENAKIFQQIERRAFIDELTGFYNYRGFEQQLEAKLELMREEEGLLALLVIDVDHFKKVNDEFGHLMGNQALQHIANVLKQHVRKNDIVARYGGEEFTVILPDTNREEAYDIAERMRQAVRNQVVILSEDLTSEKEIVIKNTVSIGIAVYPEQAEDGLSLVRHADRAMYVGAKQAGRDRVSVYDAS
jgi:diguanylate cyclase (GGDEF)-like protein